jgi:hypothetical protein
MKVLVRRFAQINKATLGMLFIDGIFECFTLEDLQRDFGACGEGKVLHETAIPPGTYEAVMTFSPKFKRVLPWLQNVPYFTEIMMHGGNTDENTWGCILMGDAVTSLGTIAPGTSGHAVDRVVAKMNAAFVEKDGIQVEVVNEVKNDVKP